jgi:hypothetical protein
LDDLRRYLVRDFLKIKQDISDITNIPVHFFQSLMEFRENLEKEGDFFAFLPQDFSFSGEITATLTTAEQFSLEYLQDLSTNLNRLYNQLILKQDTLIDPEELQKIQLQLNMLENKLTSFKIGLESYFRPYQEEFTQQQKILETYLECKTDLTKSLSPVQELLDSRDRALYLSPKLNTNLSGVVGRSVRVLITTQKLIVFRYPKFSLRQKVKIISVLNASSIKRILIQDRRFRNSKLNVHLEKKVLAFFGERNILQTLKFFIERFTAQIFPQSPRYWKNWNIFWSAEGYTSLIDRFLQAEISLNSNQKKSDKNITSQFYLNPKNNTEDDRSDKQKMLIEYFEGQLEKNSQRIRICEFIINDLKSRKNAMSVNEYYSLFENFSMKLKELEADRSTLLGQYQRANS